MWRAKKRTRDWLRRSKRYPAVFATVFWTVNRARHDRPPAHRSRVSAEARVARLRPREERAARAHLDPAHLAGAAAVGREPGDLAGDAAGRSRDRGGSTETAQPDGGDSGGRCGSGRRGRAGDAGRDSPLGVRERADRRRRAQPVPRGDSRGIRRAGTAGAGSVRRRRGDSAGGDAAGVRGGGGRPEPGGVVPPAVHAAPPARAGRSGAPLPAFAIGDRAFFEAF